MPQEICPLLLISKSKEKAKCLKNDCKWFFQLEGMPEGRGICSIFRIGYELRRLEEKLEYINKNLWELLSKKE